MNNPKNTIATSGATFCTANKSTSTIPANKPPTVFPMFRFSAQNVYCKERNTQSPKIALTSSASLRSSPSGFTNIANTTGAPSNRHGQNRTKPGSLSTLAKQLSPTT